MQESKEPELRTRVFKSLTEYLNSKPKEVFVPGNAWVRYAGRVFDYNEYLKLLDSLVDGWITAGRYTEDFELELSNYLGLYSTTFVNSGSSANLIALSSLTSNSLGKNRLMPGDEVITAAAGFRTTVNPIVQNNLISLSFDADLGAYNLNPDLPEDTIIPKISTITVAHTLENSLDLDKILKFKEEHIL